MEGFLFALILFVNLGISWWNARAVGQVWEDAKLMGGWLRVVVWSGAIQSAIGFSMVLLVALGALAYFTGYLPVAYAQKAFSLWYVLIIVPALLSGYVILIESWKNLFRERSFMNFAAAGWNTYASISNTMSMIENMGPALAEVGSLFSGLDDEDDAKAMVTRLVIGLVAISIVGGAIVTWLIIKHYRGTLPKPKALELAPA